MKVLIAGAHGLTGKRIFMKLARRGHEPIAILRSEEHVQEMEKLLPVDNRTYKFYHIADLVKDQEKICEEFIPNCDAFVFAAGAASKSSKTKATDEMTTQVDRNSAIATAKACDKHKKRFVVLSAIYADKPEFWGKELKHYMQCKRDADEYILNNCQFYTIVRPGVLTDECGTGNVHCESESFPPDQVKSLNTSRDNVAEFIVACLQNLQETNKKTFTFVDGDKPINKLWKKT